MRKHITKIIVVIMAVAVVLCFLAVAFSEELTDKLGGTGVQMEYETKLFNTDEVMQINILMDEDDWQQMLDGAMSEVYYVCDVEINGLTVKNVAIRPKGNTSLSAIVSDPNSDRYSLKLEFDHFVDGQTCYGLDKLILNNNYADATNMKEAIIYDMYRYIGADASLYNYAKVSVNGEYRGVYLALEGVEESFMLRNFGTQDGELYKPDSLEMGGNKSSSGNSSGSPSFPGGGGFNFDPGSFDFDPSSLPNGGDFNFDPNNMPNGGDFNFDPNSMPNGGGFNFNPNGSQNGGSDDTENEGNSSFNPNNMPNGGSFDPSSIPNGGSFDFDPNNIPGGGQSGDTGKGSFGGRGGSGGKGGGTGKGDSGTSRPDMGNFDFSAIGGKGGGKGGFSMGGNGANLNYTGDDLDNYTTIWDGEITGTSKADHRRVVEALKNISEGTDLETYLDVDNVLKYMAVHTFSVNMDSLSGSMAHNYYLYEYDGQLNIFPWDYNLSFGGMSMGTSGDATDIINDAIDTPFSGTQFFDALLENEEYLARYHEYLQQLVDEYVKGGRFKEVYNRIRSQIDGLVEDDPTAFYTYDEYETAVKMLYDMITLRAESIDGQLKGTIPSTDNGQKQNTASFVDGSGIDVKAMGQFSMGGFGGGSDSKGDKTATDETQPQAKTRGEKSADGNRRFMGGFSGSFPGSQTDNTKRNQLILYGICFAIMIAAILGVKLVRRRRL